MKEYRALIIGNNKEHLQELKELLINCNTTPVASIKIKNINYKYYLNQSQFEKVFSLIRKFDINLLVIDDNLSVSQERNLEKIFNISVLDRTAVILDIFALHAKTKAGQLQVELAQTQYLYSRLTGLWTHLEKLQGGIGSRGPGESQLETDKRLIKNKILNLENKLRKYDNALENSKKQRNNSNIIQVSLIGYTNSGKSALFNILSDTNDAKVKNELFATLDPLTRRVKTKECNYLINDTVGFIRKLPHQLVKSFHSTLNIINESQILLEVYDASKSIERLIEEENIINETLSELKANNIRRIKIFNKIDLISEQKQKKLSNLFPKSVFISCENNIGIDKLNNKVYAIISEYNIVKDVIINYDQYQLLHNLYEIKAVKSCKNTEDGLKLHLNISAENYNKLFDGL